MEDMTEKELITVLIDKYTDLQRIKTCKQWGGKSGAGVSDQSDDCKAGISWSVRGGYYVMTEKEWRMFNDILLEIYYAGSLETFGERCLN